MAARGAMPSAAGIAAAACCKRTCCVVACCVVRSGSRSAAAKTLYLWSGGAHNSNKRTDALSAQAQHMGRRSSTSKRLNMATRAAAAAFGRGAGPRAGGRRTCSP